MVPGGRSFSSDITPQSPKTVIPSEAGRRFFFPSRSCALFASRMVLRDEMAGLRSEESLLDFSSVGSSRARRWQAWPTGCAASEAIATILTPTSLPNTISEPKGEHLVGAFGPPLMADPPKTVPTKQRFHLLVTGCGENRSVAEFKQDPADDFS